MAFVKLDFPVEKLPFDVVPPKQCVYRFSHHIRAEHGKGLFVGAPNRTVAIDEQDAHLHIFEDSFGRCLEGNRKKPIFHNGVEYDQHEYCHSLGTVPGNIFYIQQVWNDDIKNENGNNRNR